MEPNDDEDGPKRGGTMAFDEKLAERVRGAIGKRRDVVEKKMFGGVAFMVRGHMSCGIVGETLMVRIDPAREGALLRERGARPMDFTGRPMRGFLFVDGPGIAGGAALRKWVGRAVEFAESRPKKTAGRKPGPSRARA
jgi:TfoX/Sxy family transcriptional regulator of competence genes